MAKDFAQDIYDGNPWKLTSKSYKRHKHGICERCGAPGKIVHHKTYLTPENIHDDAVVYGFDNLELLCQTCHNCEHMSRDAAGEGLMFTADGDLVRVAPPNAPLAWRG